MARGHAYASTVTRREELTRLLFAQLQDAVTDDEREHITTQLVEINLPLGDALAARYLGRGVDFDDLVQVARTALWVAIGRFRPAEGRSFVSFAVPTITGELKRYFRDHCWVVRPAPPDPGAPGGHLSGPGGPRAVHRSRRDDAGDRRPSRHRPEAGRRVHDREGRLPAPVARRADVARTRRPWGRRCRPTATSPPSWSTGWHSGRRSPQLSPRDQQVLVLALRRGVHAERDRCTAGSVPDAGQPDHPAHPRHDEGPARAGIARRLTAPVEGRKLPTVAPRAPGDGRASTDERLRQPLAPTAHVPGHLAVACVGPARGRTLRFG